AWFNVFSVSSTHSGTIADEHPEWICRDENGNPMTAYRAASPGLDAVRDYTIDVAMEIVRNYDIDGLHLDYVRWNEYDTDDMTDPMTPLEQESKLDGFFSKERINKFNSVTSTNRFIYDVEHPFSYGVPSGFSTWEDWRRWSVTEFVKTLHDSIQAVKPWVRLTPAALGKYKYGGTSGWNGYYIVFQDAALWFNEGYVDQLTPMHYHWLTGNDLYNHISSDWEPNIQQGINEGRLYSCGPGSYRLADNNVWGNHVGMVEKNREKEWVDGFQFFSYGSWKGYNYWEEAASTFFNNKVKVRNAYFIAEPSAPNLALNKIDSLSYEITITPDVSETEDQWYAIYRSEDDILDVNNDIIIDIHFGNTAYLVNEIFSGNQNFNGSYEYFATTLNRHWNESAISNSETTDLIPSLAPTIVTSTPAENEVVDISQVIVIEFSKSMNIDSFTDIISITPEVQINSLTWSDENRTLSIDTDNFVYATSYTLVIDSTAEDVNGVQLDGDGNGIPGDSFILNFQTGAADIFPPLVTANNPENNDLNVDIASIITVEFDEKVDDQTLAGNGIKLWNNYFPIDFSYLHTETPDGRSVISIQPNDLLDISTTYKLTLGASISDILGNALGEEINIIFTTSRFLYEETTMIENFTNPGDWKQPSYSGSTTGIFESGTHFEYTEEISLPASSSKKVGKLSYLWDESADAFLLREYLSGGTPQSTYFDTSYVLQSYVFGDGSNNQYRFCIDEFQGGGWGDHEVSKWVTIDWHGWRLIEWQLNDPNSVGTWFCDEILTGSYFRVDSYQLTKSETGLISGAVYFDDLRAVKKYYIPTDVDETNENIPDEFVLFQNYPNP
ncbi:MAG: Ig-like domain-containing protein, partial [Melioribacteraceae bacterium]|nr:Ig-like domain-containing protein [Melioribacteraceae bacterium]